MHKIPNTQCLILFTELHKEPGHPYLTNWICELRKCIANLTTTNEKFESLNKGANMTTAREKITEVNTKGHNIMTCTKTLIKESK
jgi:septation ring formation regulator EzrA